METNSPKGKRIGLGVLATLVLVAATIAGGVMFYANRGRQTQLGNDEAGRQRDVINATHAAKASPTTQADLPPALSAHGRGATQPAGQ